MCACVTSFFHVCFLCDVVLAIMPLSREIWRAYWRLSGQTDDDDALLDADGGRYFRHSESDNMESNKFGGATQ